MNRVAAVGVVNNSGETIPPGAAMEPDGTTDALGRLGVRKPTADGSAVWFNGPVPILVGQAGQGHSPYPWVAAGVADADRPLAARQQLGVVAGNWQLRTTGLGYRAIAAELGGLVAVVPEWGVGFDGGSSAGGSGRSSFLVHRNPRCEAGRILYDQVTITIHGPVWVEES